ncbi:MAG TPA: NADPH-dependent F420 reductase [Kribbella sp.]|nr:NADPH-dependent F420 reductase [Kribbella sp.]
MSKVTIIGAGNMGRGIGTRLVSGGHEVQILARTAEEATAVAEELGRDGSSVIGGGIDGEITGDIVVLAAPYEGALDFVQKHGDQLVGKVVVDITNPVDWATFDRLVTPADSSAAQEIAARLPAGVAVVKAFNTTFAQTLVAGGVAGHDLDVLIAGDDTGAKAAVAALVESGGMRPIDAGPLRRAQQLEHLGFLHMALQDELGTGYGSAVKFVGPT